MNKLVDFVTTRIPAQRNQLIANVLMIIGVMINLIDMVQNGMTMKWGPVVAAVAFVLVGFFYQLLFVKCPHCGDKLKGHKTKMKLPDRCPNCNKRLDKLPKKKAEN